ncbi:MAG: 16S rRNA (cytidine(1402)-2'-O)-methyltransferase [Nitrospinales bacterium]
MPATEAKGSLYIVSTPLGNLGDITYRAVRQLEAVSLIAAEDTRRSRILLNHYGIKTALSSYNSYNKVKKGREFIAWLKSGKDLALVSDAGTPGISDPLYHLAQLALAEDIAIHPLPGPAAVVAALSVSGLPMDRFVFEGFLPRKKRRKQYLEDLAGQRRTIVLYESPHRVDQTLRDLLQVFGDRKIAIARELTKIHEEVIRGSLAELVARAGTRKWRGEVTLVIAGCG